MNWQQACELPYYNGTDLGANYTPAATTFKLWAPTAAAVTVELFATGTDAEPNAHHLGAHHLQWERDGVWSLTLSGDWKNTYYLYHLQFHDGRTADAVDPYARTAGANGQRAMVLDLDAAAPEGWAEDKRPVIPPHARSVWEVHVADFSADEHSGVPAEYRGKFMGFVPGDTTLDGDGVHPTCLNYLKDLGVSHVQLQPIFDYETVDESRPDGGYNWGYDPQNYNVPEGSFATDPFHGEVRVRECRAMVAALHRAGLGVVMDVVYNHTYHSDSNLERTVPGYWNRRWPNDQMTNGSGCGCDLASERPMVRKYIVDSILYWAQTYHIDGFRFDLMALEDADTMNAIRAALDALPGGQDILLYGEPWQGGSTNFEGGARPADKRALDVLSDRIGFFCDDTRDSIKGNVFDAGNAGYVNGAPQHGYEVLHSIGAWRGGQHGYWPRQAGQVVQYISAHDNLTLWDKLAAVGRRGDYDAPDAELLAQNRLAAGIYLTCQGLPFMQAGEELQRPAGDQQAGLDAGAPPGICRINGILSRYADHPPHLRPHCRGLRRAAALCTGAAGVAHRVHPRKPRPQGCGGRLLQPRTHPPVGQPAHRQLAQADRRRARRYDPLWPDLSRCHGAAAGERDGAEAGIIKIAANKGSP